MSRLLDPPSSFSQRQTPGSTIYSTRSPYGDFPSSGTILQTPKTTRTVRTDASLTGSVSRRRHSTSYTPLETVSSNVMGATNSWSGVSAPQLRRGSSSTDRRRGLSGDHISTPIIARGQSAEPVSAAEIMTVYHQHSTLYPDECIPSSWACGSSLKEAADVTNKLESLLSQAKKNPSIANYVANVTDALRLMPGLFSSDAFHENERTSCGSNADALSTEVLVNSSSPDRYLGSDLHGQLTPKGREELLSGKKICHQRGIRHL